MAIAKLNNKDIFDGCLPYLRSELIGELPPGRKWNTGSDNGIINLVGCKEAVNEHNFPYDNPPSYYKIYFGNHLIRPISYSLLGRRTHIDHQLKGWNFYGRSINYEWVLLSSLSNSDLSQNELRTYELNTTSMFNGFMIEMTHPGTKNNWVLTIGQIDVHGYIYDYIPKSNNCITQTYHFLLMNVFFLFIILI